MAAQNSTTVIGPTIMPTDVNRGMTAHDDVIDVTTSNGDPTSAGSTVTTSVGETTPTTTQLPTTTPISTASVGDTTSTTTQLPTTTPVATTVGDTTSTTRPQPPPVTTIAMDTTTARLMTTTPSQTTSTTPMTTTPTTKMTTADRLTVPGTSTGPLIPVPTDSSAIPVGSATTTDVTTFEPSGGGLSTGAIAGIAVGVIAVFAIVIVVVLFLIWKKRKQEKSRKPQSDDNPSEYKIRTDDNKNAKRTTVMPPATTNLYFETDNTNPSPDGVLNGDSKVTASGGDDVAKDVGKETDVDKDVVLRPTDKRSNRAILAESRYSVGPMIIDTGDSIYDGDGPTDLFATTTFGG